MSAPTAASILLAAADHCDETGLHQRLMWPGADRLDRYRDGDPCCAIGHIVVAMGHRESITMPRGVQGVLQRVRNHLGLSVGGLAAWSDAPGRTASEVSSALRAAAGGAR